MFLKAQQFYYNTWTGTSLSKRCPHVFIIQSGSTEKFTMIFWKELLIMAISIFKATMTVQTTWASIKMRPNVDTSLNAGSFTTILSSSMLPSNSQNAAMNVSVCLKGTTNSRLLSRSATKYWRARICIVS